MKLLERVICADGFEMSVQAHEGAYCTPRVTGAERYTAVEVGFPSRSEPMLMEWADEPDKPTETVYGWVPSQTVGLVIAKHGGMVGGEVPAGVPPLQALPKGWES
mgnify:FL=1|tara:strand:+ start:1077 stop:1391 length:315 start_codon:yes stop_codon:yes gene_type:complete